MVLIMASCSTYNGEAIDPKEKSLGAKKKSILRSKAPNLRVKESMEEGREETKEEGEYSEK